MSWQEIYKDRLMSPAEAARIVQSGDCIMNPLALGQVSSEIMNAITDRASELEDILMSVSMTFRPYDLFRPELRNRFQLLSCFFSSPIMKLIAKSEWANHFPMQAADVGRKIGHRMRTFPRPLGMLMQVSPPDNHGFVNIGLDAFSTEAAMNQAKWIIAQVNPHMPRTYGRTNFHVSRFTAFVEHAEPVFPIPIPDATKVEKKMAENVMTLLHDRDCIQIGIGAVPAMISRLLEHSGLKDLGIHTEMVPAGTHRLVEKGIVTGKYKKTNTGKIITSFTLGDQELYDFVSNNPLCEFHPAGYTNLPMTIAQESNVVAINGSIEVDLTGQIVSESIGNTMISGSGGQLDFAVGSFWSEGGRAINLVPSTGSDDKISRIVPYLTPGSRVTVPRQYAGYIVTEYGIADLYGRTEPERAVELIRIAHPKFREDLERGARERGFIKKTIYCAA